jgi:hypothetical protein
MCASEMSRLFLIGTCFDDHVDQARRTPRSSNSPGTGSRNAASGSRVLSLSAENPRLLFWRMEHWTRGPSRLRGIAIRRLGFDLLQLTRWPPGLSPRAIRSRLAFTLDGLFFPFSARSCHRGVLYRRRDPYAKRFRPLLFGKGGGPFLLGIDQAFGVSVQPRLNARRYLWRLLLRRHHSDGRLNSREQKRCRAAYDGNRSKEVREQAKQETHGTNAMRPKSFRFRISIR